LRKRATAAPRLAASTGSQTASKRGGVLKDLTFQNARVTQVSLVTNRPNLYAGGAMKGRAALDD
jgi:hypothetical protein